MRYAKRKPARGEKRRLMDGQIVTILDKVGVAYKVINEKGNVQVVYLAQIMEPQNQ